MVLNKTIECVNIKLYSYFDIPSFRSSVWGCWV